MCVWERERVIDSGRETRRYRRRWHWAGTWHIRQRNSGSCNSVGCIQTLRPLLEREQWTFQSEEEGQLSINEIMYQAGPLMLYAMCRPPGSICSLQPPWRCQVLGKAVNLGCCPSLGCDPLSRGVPLFLPRSWPFVSAPPPVGLGTGEALAWKPCMWSKIKPVTIICVCVCIYMYIYICIYTYIYIYICHD